MIEKKNGELKEVMTWGYCLECDRGVDIFNYKDHISTKRHQSKFDLNPLNNSWVNSIKIVCEEVHGPGSSPRMTKLIFNPKNPQEMEDVRCKLCPKSFDEWRPHSKMHTKRVKDYGIPEDSGDEYEISADHRTRHSGEVRDSPISQGPASFDFRSSLHLPSYMPRPP